MLDLLDESEKIFEFGIRLAKNTHAAEVADVALVIAPGIERENIASLEGGMDCKATSTGMSAITAPFYRALRRFKR